MDLNKVQESLDILSRVGIEEVALVSDTSEDDEAVKTVIRGASADKQIVIYHTLDTDYIDGYTIGILSIKPFLSRLNLFDINKAKVDIEDDGAGKKVAEQLTIKQGRRKITYRCYDIGYLSIPSRIPSNLNDGSQFVFDSEYTQYLLKVISSLIQTASDKTEAKVSMSYSDSTIKLTMDDGEDDKFVEEITHDEEIEDVDNTTWSMVSFAKLLKESLSQQEETRFKVTEYGVAIFEIGGLELALAPA
jgi:hypothetical protein